MLLIATARTETNLWGFFSYAPKENGDAEISSSPSSQDATPLGETSSSWSEYRVQTSVGRLSPGETSRHSVCVYIYTYIYICIYIGPSPSPRRPSSCLFPRSPECGIIVLRAGTAVLMTAGFLTVSLTRETKLSFLRLLLLLFLLIFLSPKKPTASRLQDRVAHSGPRGLVSALSHSLHVYMRPLPLAHMGNAQTRRGYPPRRRTPIWTNGGGVNSRLVFLELSCLWSQSCQTETPSRREEVLWKANVYGSKRYFVCVCLFGLNKHLTHKINEHEHPSLTGNFVFLIQCPKME